MKKIILILLLPLILFTSDTLGQMHRNGRGNGKGPGHKKLEQLEKIKLLEVLNMDDATAIKFFNRLGAHKDKMMEYGDRTEDILDLMQKEIEKGDNSPEFNKLIKEFNAVEEKVNQERQSFINSLNDILSPAQITKVIVFEKKFREEVRNVLMREKVKRQNKNN